MIFMCATNPKDSKRKQFKNIIKTTGLKTTINTFQNILDAIWSNVFSTPKFDSYLKPRIRTCPGISSSIDTLNGINELCEIADFPDAYLLMRKLRDNLFLDLFLFEAQKNFEKVPDDLFTNIDFSNVEEFVNALNDYNLWCIKKELNTEELIAINKWKNDELLMSNGADYKRNYFQFSRYLSYINDNNKDFNICYTNFLKESFSKMGLELNDYAHSNGTSAIIINEKPQNVLFNIKKVLIRLERLFIISLFFIDSSLLSSDDYGDYIECNMTPPEGSQYWINGYIKDVFLEIKRNNKSLFKYLVEHNKYLMDIDIK